MNTLDELLYYCNENEPVGALLLTGEWGCGKTYLINNELEKSLENSAIILKLSLFGVSSVEGIHGLVKTAWTQARFKEMGIDEYARKANKIAENISKLAILPEKIREIASTDLSIFFDMDNKLNEKSVILVFDDLERCSLNVVDVLGVINEYCENKKFHTIIVANQAKIKVSVCGDSDQSDDEISYAEIKEKIIQRTVEYAPNYEAIISSVISNMNYRNQKYKEFIQKYTPGLLSLFAPEIVDQRPHNIRSFKCAISDFCRVYEILEYHQMDNLDNWLYSFVAFVSAYRAGMVKEGEYGTLFLEEEVKTVYPSFREQYLLTQTKKWILHGTWDENAATYEIELLKERAKDREPYDIIKISRIMDLDEQIITAGIGEYLNMLYTGGLTLDEYVVFIQNCVWSRADGYAFPGDIDWTKVKHGILQSIERLKCEPLDRKTYHSTLEKGYCSGVEWDCYMLIYNWFFPKLIEIAYFFKPK